MPTITAIEPVIKRVRIASDEYPMVMLKGTLVRNHSSFDLGFRLIERFVKAKRSLR